MLSCEQIDTAFRQSEQAVSKGLITKKMVVKNAYYGKIPDGEMFPLRSGTRIKGIRLGRIGIPDQAGWRPVDDTLCESNACSFEPEVVSHGHSDYFFSLVQRDLRTDWLCIDSLALRDMPEQELAHLEDGLRSAARYVHEEFRRSRYLLFGRHKHVGIVPLVDGDVPPAWDSCDPSSELLDNAYVFEARDNGEMDECHVRVCCKVSEIPQISRLTLDMLDEAREVLQYEDELYLDGTNLFDVLVAGQTIGRDLALQENAQMGNGLQANVGGYNLLDLSLAFGTQRVIRDCSIRNDLHAMKFFPDDVVNATLADEDFDENDPSTWARFVRVFPYVPTKSAIAGIEYKSNSHYRKAPFGISTILTPRVMSVMSFPQVSGVGPAKKMGGFGYDGTAQWQNPDWQCNTNRDKGFWKLRFRLAAKQDRDEEGHSWFHRCQRTIRLAGSQCQVPATPAFDEVTPYCFAGMGGAHDSGEGFNRISDARGTPFATTV